MNVAIIGTGAYGMALASVFYNNKCNVKMWTNSEEEKKMLLKNGKSDKVELSSVYYYKDAVMDEMKNIKQIPKTMLETDELNITQKW